MNDKIIDVLKYFFLTFFSLGLMYYIARSNLNLGLILLVSIAFTILYALDKFKVIGKIFFPLKGTTSDNIKKDQAM
jgi:hypothetical protein